MSLGSFQPKPFWDSKNDQARLTHSLPSGHSATKGRSFSSMTSTQIPDLSYQHSLLWHFTACSTFPAPCPALLSSLQPVSASITSRKTNLIPTG